MVLWSGCHYFLRLYEENKNYWRNSHETWRCLLAIGITGFVLWTILYYEGVRRVSVDVFQSVDMLISLSIDRISKYVAIRPEGYMTKPQNFTFTKCFNLFIFYKSSKNRPMSWVLLTINCSISSTTKNMKRKKQK